MKIRENMPTVRFLQAVVCFVGAAFCAEAAFLPTLVRFPLAVLLIAVGVWRVVQSLRVSAQEASANKDGKWES